MNNLLRLLTLLSLLVIATTTWTTSVFAWEPALKDLEVTPKTKKLEVRHSQIGYRSTLLFYTFDELQTVLKLQVGNKDTTFPISATVYIFEDGTTAEGLKKWLNNQHSDGLYPDVPNPKATIKLPATACKATAHKLLGKSRAPFGNYNDYEVTFAVKEYSDMRNVQLKAFSGVTKVHIKSP